MNTQDYKWITQGRDVIMAQCAQLSEAQLAQSHGFALDSVKDTLLHITKCYRNWIGSFLSFFRRRHPPQRVERVGG